MTKAEKLKQSIEDAKANAKRFKDKNLKTFWENVVNGLHGKMARASIKELSEEV